VAGHSKWANIKRRKGAQDAARGKLFTKLIKEIMVAAKMGGSDIDANPRLRLAVDKAKANSMPKDNIERAIAKGAGELTGDDYENLIYEGYGPNGVAILIECLTDNRNRTASEVRSAFNKGGGSMGTSGSVAWMFQQKGVFTLPRDIGDEETVMMAALEGGAEDVVAEGDTWQVTTAFESYAATRAALAELDEDKLNGELTWVPDTEVTLGLDEAQQLMGLLERLEDCDDVQDTYTNADIPDEIADQL
jgi:YebC/PmpR family DNA-binding regulatory protein